MPPRRIAIGLSWPLAAVVGAAWAGRRLVDTWWFFDEWSMIGRVISYDPVEGATTSFNGHLWFFQDVFFRLQANVFGLESNTFLVVLFIISLVTLHMTLAALFVRVRVPTVTAAMLAGLLTYMGTASQNFVFAIQVSPTFATAASIGVAVVVLDRSPTRARTVTAGALMLLAVLFDSGVGLLGVALGGGVIVLTWPRSRWWPMLPSVVLLGAWFAVGDLGPRFPAPVDDRAVFAIRLLLRSAGAVVGGGAVWGAVVLATCLAATAFVWRSGRFIGPTRVITIAGAAGTLVTTAGIAQTRAGLPDFDFFDFNRYLQNIGIPLAITFVPAVTVATKALLADLADRGERDSTPLVRIAPAVAPVLAPLLIVGSFVASLDDERAYADAFLSWNAAVEARVEATTLILRDGCPNGAAIDRDSRPAGDLSPQIRTSLVAELVERGLLDVPDEPAPDPAVVSIVCPPA